MSTVTSPPPLPPINSGEENKKPKNKVSTIAMGIVMILCGLLGICVLGYPVLSTQLNNYEQSKLAQNFSQQAELVTPEEAEAALQSAREYNKSIEGIALDDPWTTKQSPNDPEYQRYLAELSKFDTMGQLSISSINVNLPIYHGTSDATLMKGVGHLFGTALPVGGEGTRSVLTAHSGIPKATLFDNLEKVKIGDAIYTRSIAADHKYEVIDREVILPDEIDKINPVPGQDLITLITCTPYGINTHRLLVTAQRVPMDPHEADEAFASNGMTWQWWMKAVLAVFAVLLVLLIIALIRLWRAKKKQHKPEAVSVDSEGNEQ